MRSVFPPACIGRQRHLHVPAGAWNFTLSRETIVKKLRLEDIQVESYVTQQAQPARGTVQANAITDLCDTFKCPTNVGSCATNRFCC
jgi:hypothetical protein